MARNKSKSARWAEATAEARKAFADMEEARELFLDKLVQVYELQLEYIEWLDNMPDSLQDSATADKLREIENLELELDSSADWSDMEQAIDEAENADLPMGFGRD